MKILIAECMQEISSFNPLPSEYADFTIEREPAFARDTGRNTALAGALAVFDRNADVEIVPTISARAGSAGILSAAGWQRLSSEWLAAVAPHAGPPDAPKVDALYISLHGAMGAEGEPDPEGYLLERVRTLFGPDVKLVVSLDLHGILTTRMLRQIDGLTLYHTYPHVDFADTGRRAALLLLDIVRRGLKPVIARVRVPLLARGDECITKTGCYGDVIADAQALERSGQALAAGVMIGNPFTDAPELCTQALVVAECDAAAAGAAATALAEAMWASRHRLVGKWVSVEKAVAMAPTMQGPILFTDAADATSSGASGDSNVLIKALWEAHYPGHVLAQIVDPPAAAAAHAAGVGARIEVSLGGVHDPARFTPMRVTATVESLSRGRARLETMGQPLDAGPTAVLRFGRFTVVVMSHTVSLFDRAMYYSNGLNPTDFDLIVVKSPHTEFHMYDQWVTKNFNVDAPGATSANLPTLGHRLCARPMFPLDPDASFTPRTELFARTAAQAPE
jgi:microcystin degradation protein MlrC